jgi:hypothetical protein
MTFKFIPLKLRLSSVLLHMDMNSYILHTQNHTLLHSWTLDATDGSITHQDAWMLPSFTHLLYNILKIFNPSPQWRNSHSWARASHYCGFTITLRRTTVLYDYSRHVISLTQRPLCENTQHSQERHPCPERNSNSEYQQANGGRPMPYTAWPLG